VKKHGNTVVDNFDHTTKPKAALRLVEENFKSVAETAEPGLPDY
jgi:hypothetical protein